MHTCTFAHTHTHNHTFTYVKFFSCRAFHPWPRIQIAECALFAARAVPRTAFPKICAVSARARTGNIAPMKAGGMSYMDMFMYVIYGYVDVYICMYLCMYILFL